MTQSAEQLAHRLEVIAEHPWPWTDKPSLLAAAEMLRSMEKDAARYQYVKDRFAVTILKKCPAKRDWMDAREVVDEAVDAAMADDE